MLNCHVPSFRYDDLHLGYLMNASWSPSARQTKDAGLFRTLFKIIALCSFCIFHKLSSSFSSFGWVIFAFLSGKKEKKKVKVRGQESEVVDGASWDRYFVQPTQSGEFYTLYLRPSSLLSFYNNRTTMMPSKVLNYRKILVSCIPKKIWKCSCTYHIITTLWIRYLGDMRSQ